MERCWLIWGPQVSCSTGTLMGAERVRFPPFQLPPDKASPLLNSIAQRSFRHMGQHGKRKERDSKGAGLSLLFLYLEDQLGLMWGGIVRLNPGINLGCFWDCSGARHRTRNPTKFGPQSCRNRPRNRSKICHPGAPEGSRGGGGGAGERLGLSWGRLEPSWGRLGPSWGRLGAVMEASHGKRKERSPEGVAFCCFLMMFLDFRGNSNTKPAKKHQWPV